MNLIAHALHIDCTLVAHGLHTERRQFMCNGQPPFYLEIKDTCTTLYVGTSCERPKYPKTQVPNNPDT